MYRLLSAYENLGSVDMKSSLRQVGYGKCWDSPEFRPIATARIGVGQELAVLGKLGPAGIRRDQEDEIRQELLLRLEHTADIPEQAQFFAEVVVAD